MIDIVRLLAATIIAVWLGSLAAGDWACSVVPVGTTMTRA